MNLRSTLPLAVLLLSASPALAQPYGHWSKAPDPQEPTTPEPSLVEKIAQGTTEEVIPAVPALNNSIRVERGALPDFLARRYNQNMRKARSAAARRSGQRSGGRGGSALQSGPRRITSNGTETTFVDNAFQFDSNNDRQLAAHELSTLFLVLTTIQQQENDAANGSNSSLATGGANGSIFETVNSGLLRRQSVRDAQATFVQLAMSFDNNSDGQLNRGEVSSMGSCLQQNNLSLTDAAQQNVSINGGTLPPGISAGPTTQPTAPTTTPASPTPTPEQ